MDTLKTRCQVSAATTGMLCDGSARGGWQCALSLSCCVGAEWTVVRSAHMRLTRESTVSVHVGGSDIIHIGARWA